MNLLREKFRASPIYCRVAPFVIFLVLTFCQSGSGGAQYWFYLIKIIAGAWLIWEMRPFVPEMRWAISWEAVVIGVLVFVMWVGIDPYYTHQGDLGKVLGLSHEDKAPVPAWNPNVYFGAGSAAAWFFMVMRVAGMSLVVPPLEEVFWRSFLYRWFVRTDFEAMPLSRFHPTSFIVTSALFGFEHDQWLAGILCGFAYQWLAVRKNRLGDAMTAHAITNCMLGVYVIWKGAWQFF